ncbi:subtilisin-like protein [Macrolepiota fuliginosa MF-IS2]|uniref:tripeptidyl-peptidase II n=1 Tax=Macrolepiota fuliginosa MF-IS2 TaxID=1400762 RepID=A0A9P5XGS1_9AGAR|nr:subtilisin-like protein [Macrolepiota fuliginosa MF-IS2]
MRLFISVVLAITGSVLAKDADCHFKLKESVALPRGWVKHGLPPADHNINLRIGLPQPNFKLLEQHLYEVSDPFHERYGQHLSKEEVEALVAPHQESLDSVDKWLASFGIGEGDAQRSPAKDWVKLRVPVALAEKMLNTTYYVWKHLESGDYLVRTTSYSLPVDVHAHVDVVQPTTMFGRFKGSKSTVVSIGDAPDAPKISTSTIDIGNGIMVDPSCNTTITVTCLEQLYNATSFQRQGKGTIGITGYLEQNANIQDLETFFAEQRPDAVGSNFTFISVAGGINNQSLAAAGDEANLDVQFAFGISHPVPATFYSTAGRPPFIPDVNTPTDTNEPYSDWLDFVLSHPNPPSAISTSYGDDEQTVPESFAKKACQGFAQLGARGVSLMFSSGDGGVGDNDPNPATQTCFTNDGRNVTRFIPGFPASCPFVTAVGGTTNVPEVAVSRFFSGGGFSDYFERPAYQDKVVQNYLNALPKGTYEGLFNPNGRAFPDVSAQSDRYRIWVGGRAILIGGTSASSPAFTGFVALLNDARLQKGLPPLGFLNPLFYSQAAGAFNDITVGHNSGCGTTGFNATKGWDPVTGLGTPNFGKLVAVVTAGKH